MAREMIKEHEGKSLDVYKDSRGKKTVGYGHLIDADSPEDIRNLKIGEKISEERAEQLFDQDYSYHASAAREIPGFSRASESQKEALIDLTFNMGPAWYEDFPKFAKAFEEGDYEKAAQELKDSDWYDQVGRRAPVVISMIEGGKDDPSMIRPDGTRKSNKGFLGQVKDNKGRTMTEFSIGVQIDGEEVDIPTLVPGLTDDEINSLKDGNVPVSVQQKAKAHAEKRIAQGLSPFYQDGEKPKGKVNFDRIVVGPETKVAQAKPKVNYRNIIVIPDSAKESFELLDQMERQRSIGLITEVGEGITLGLLGELAAVAEAATSDRSYQEAKDDYELARKRFKRENPALATYAVPLELAATIPTGIGLARGLGKLGVKSAAGQLGIEGAGYGLATGETFEQRITNAGIGVLTGLTLGRVIDVATSPSKAGGLKTDKDFEADASLDVDSVGEANRAQQAEAQRFFDEVDDPAYRRKPLSEAETVGELWGGLKTSFQNFYNQQLRGVSDNLWAQVSPQVGAGVQRADTAALLTMNKEFSDLSEQLIPVIKTINESEFAKGALLDYSAGQMTDPNKLRLLNTERARLKRTGGADGLKKADDLEKSIRSDATDKLLDTLSNDLTVEQRAILKRYLGYSFQKNQKLNKDVFGAKFINNLTYLHTRLTKDQIKKLKEDRKLTDEQLEGLFDDPAFKERTRGSYIRKDDNAPNPLDYENPIVSDIQRLQRLEQFSQMKRVFNPDIQSAVRRKGSSLTPNEFMNELEFKFFERGISPEGSKYARQQISDMIMGQEKAPHPLIQALNSIAYATTLAGPMSAILNLADVPLLGAKYGGKAVREGIKEADPRMLTPFKKPSDINLKELGLNNQVFGEFVSQINELQSGGTNWMMKTSKAARQSADFLMKKSGFAALDVVGKKGVMRGILSSAADDANAGKLADNWSFYFNNGELDIISKQLKAHGTNYSKYTGKGKELVEELMFAGLGQQQLISAAGRPAGWARNPNLRPLWALRGFVIKQQALALREVVGNIKAGKPDKAAEFLGRYALYGAGGYAVINEGRQYVFGDGNASFGGLARGYGDAWASLLTANTLGLNDYQYGQIKQNGLLYTFAEGMMPLAPSRAADILGTTIDVLDSERPPQALITETFPIVKQTLRAGRNIAEKLEDTSTQGMLEEALRRRNPEKD